MANPSDADKAAAAKLGALPPTPEQVEAAMECAECGRTHANHGPLSYGGHEFVVPRWSSVWTPPTDERTPINVHPIAMTELRKLLQHEPELRGVGYSAFIMRAIRQWQEDHD